MKRHKITSIPVRLSDSNLDDFNDLFEDIMPKQSRYELRRWRKLKHQQA